MIYVLDIYIKLSTEFNNIFPEPYNEIGKGNKVLLGSVTSIFFSVLKREAY